jgi:hypothetical protein
VRRHYVKDAAKSSSSEEASSGTSADASDSSGDDIIYVGGSKVKASSKRAGRALRKSPWGPFQIAEYWPKGIFSGFGATCGQHRNSAGDKTCCKKVLGFYGKTPADPVLDHAQCQLQLKRWLLHGTRIHLTDVNSRLQHRKLAVRTLAALPHEPADMSDWPGFPDTWSAPST